MASFSIVTTIALLSILLPLVQCGQILFWMPYVSKSITITFFPLAEELSSRGHQVTVVTPFGSKIKNDNLQEIVIETQLMTLFTTASKGLLSPGGGEEPPFSEILADAIKSNDDALSHPKVQEIIRDPQTTFDMVVVMVMCNDVGFYLAHKFNASLVLYSTGQASISFPDWALGQPHNPAYLPLPLFPIPAGEMTFLQRVMNTVGTTGLQVFRDHYILRQMESVLDKHFPGETRPSLLDLERNASLAFQFGHPLLVDGWRPIVPNYINIGMMNCRLAKKFDRQDKVGQFLDGASNGAIFISFGSVVQASQMPEEQLKRFLSVITRLKPIKVLWKWETEIIAEQPDNLMLSKWLPQQDVLGHANVRVFVTHGGQSSFQESLCHQMPMVVTSVYGDQYGNGEEVVRIGAGIHIPFKDITEDKLYDAIRKVFHNEEGYRQQVEKFGSILTDQIDKPLDRAVWWIEHVIRHPGQYLGRSPVHKLTWYQYFLLDVILFLSASVSLLVFITVKLITFCCCASKKDKRD